MKGRPTNIRWQFQAALTIVLSALAPLVAATAETVRQLPDKIPCAVRDQQDYQIPDRLHLTGWVGARVAGNEDQLVKFDPEQLLAGYRKPPGREDWIGEMSGKWIHTATLVGARTGGPSLRKKLDSFVAELCKCQRADGYLGTEVKPWTGPWGVWVVKYNLIGLLTHIKYTGNRDPLPTCTRMANLLCNTFGDGAGKRAITSVGYCGGMAAVSVLEPMVLLYRFTGEPRYLGFCKYLLRAWVNPSVSNLLASKRIGTGTTAYEFLACLNGALEYYRTVGGDRQILDACLIAWQDIVDKRLYITGTSSWKEDLRGDSWLKNNEEVGETCVTVTWLQFNAQLLRLTGEARFAEQLERVVLNQLFGAQRPDGAAWGYFVPMEGRKPYNPSLFGNCCLASGPRGVSLIPLFVVSTDAEGAVVNLYDAGAAKLVLRDDTAVSLATETLYPSDGRIQIAVNPAAKKPFTVKLRIPAWCRTAALNVNGEAADVAPGYTAIQRAWSPGDKIEVKLPLEPRVIVGDHDNEGKVALCYGPLVLALDEALLEKSGGQNAGSISIPSPDVRTLGVTPEPAPAKVRTWPNAQAFRVKAVARGRTATIKAGSSVEALLLPFADAGGTGTGYRVWLPLAQLATAGSLLQDGTESRSRRGNQDGFILDADLGSLVNTSDNKPAKEDWFAVTLDAPVLIRRVVFAHGKSFNNGGWFVENPKVQVQRERGITWETIGELSDCRDDGSRLKPGRTFTLRFPEAVKAVAVRVLGVPACGDNPKQAFSSCAELQAFGE